MFQNISYFVFLMYHMQTYPLLVSMSTVHGSIALTFVFRLITVG